MSIFSNLFGKNPPPVITTSEINTAVQRLYDAVNYPNIDFNSDLGRKIAALTICSKILAQDIGRLSISIFRTDENNNKVKLKEDYRYHLLHHSPNNYTDAFTFWSSTEFNRDFDGNSYVKINRSNGKVISFERLDSVQIIGTKISNGELFYSIQTNDENVDISANDILHFRNLSSDGFYGRDPKYDLAINLGISYKALVTIDKFYSNGAISTIALETVVPDNVNPTQWVKSQEDFTAKYGSYLQANKPWFLPAFTKVVPLSINFNDAQFIETIKYNNGQVAAYFGIPQHKIGNIESSKFNNLQEMQLDYINNTIAPIISMYRRELEFKLLTEEELDNGYSIELDTNALNITDSKTRIENYKSLFGMAAITPNEICKNENVPSFDGGDTHYIATGYMGLEKANGKPLPAPGV